MLMFYTVCKSVQHLSKMYVFVSNGQRFAGCDFNLF